MFVAVTPAPSFDHSPIPSPTVPLMFRNQRIDTYTQFFQAVSGIFVERDDIDEGGQILLPQSVLNDCSQMNLVYPLQFEVKSYKGTSTHCGVREFTAAEGQIVLPQWMMTSLKLEPWDMVTLSTVVLPKAQFIRLKPLETAFTELHDPRAVLETRLSKFSVLTKGDRISIHYCGQVFQLDVTVVRAKDLGEIRAASIVDTEVQVDFERPADMPESPVRQTPPPFAAPAGANVIGAGADAAVAMINFDPVKTYKPPSLKPKAAGASTEAQPAAASPTFNAFAGTGRSLSGKPVGGAPGAPSATAGKTATPAGTATPPGGAALGGGRTLNGKPAAVPPALPGDGPAVPSQPPAETQFKPFAGSGRTLR